MPCVQSTVTLECYIVLSNDFAKHQATYHSWTALSPVWGFKYTRVNSWVGENSEEMREAGTAFLIMLHNYSVLLPLPDFTSRGKRYKWMLVNLQPYPRCPGNQHAKRAPSRLSRTSLAASKADAAGSIIDWLVQLCPSPDPKTSYFLSRCITSLSLEAVWKVWTWPGRWKSGSNYVAIQWEEASRQFASDLIKLMVRNKSISTNEGSGLLKVGVSSCVKPQSQVLMLANHPALCHFRAVRVVSIK